MAAARLLPRSFKTLNQKKMAAARLLLPRSFKTLNQLINPSPIFLFSRFTSVLCSFISNIQTFDSLNEINKKITINQRNSRYFSSKAVSDALDLHTEAPVIIVFGINGSGKRAVLDHILTSEQGKRIAVTQFRGIHKNSSLVASHGTGSEGIVMMNNGCLCCNVRENLHEVLLELVKEKRDKFDMIVIETSDIENPEFIFSNDELSQHIIIVGAVTMIDCKHAMQYLNEGEARSIACSDRIILNKTELVSEADLLAITRKIKHINGLALISGSKFGAVDMDFVLGVGRYDPDRIECAVEGISEHCTDGHDHHSGHHHDHMHDPVITSVSIVSEGTVDLQEVAKWLGKLQKEKKNDLLRMKGIISLNQSPGRYFLMGDYRRLYVRPAEPWGPDEKRVNKLVFTGKNLDETAMKKAFNGCLI